MGQKQKREKTEGATGRGRATRDPIEKWNQMTVLRFHADKGETSEEPGLPSGRIASGQERYEIQSNLI